MQIQLLKNTPGAKIYGINIVNAATLLAAGYMTLKRLVFLFVY